MNRVHVGVLAALGFTVLSQWSADASVAPFSVTVDGPLNAYIYSFAYPNALSPPAFNFGPPPATVQSITLQLKYKTEAWETYKHKAGPQNVDATATITATLQGVNQQGQKRTITWSKMAPITYDCVPEHGACVVTYQIQNVSLAILPGSTIDVKLELAPDISAAVVVSGTTRWNP